MERTTQVAKNLDNYFSRPIIGSRPTTPVNAVPKQPAAVGPPQITKTEKTKPMPKVLTKDVTNQNLPEAAQVETKRTTRGKLPPKYKDYVVFAKK